MNDYLIQFALLRERVFCEPDNRDLFRRLLLCMEYLGNYAECRDLYAALLDEQPYCSLAWYNVGWAYAQLGETEEALEAFEYAYITQPYFEDAYKACAELAVERGLHRRALQCYTELDSHTAADSDVLARMGACYLQLEDVPQAKAMCCRALRLDPSHAEAHYQLGACYAAERKYGRAVRQLREAIRGEEPRAEYHTLLAVLYNYLGKPRMTLRHLWHAVELAPEEPAGWLKLAEFLLFAGRLHDAREVLEQALEHTISVELLYCSAACLFLTGDREVAVDTLQKALTTDVSRHPEIFRWAPALRDDAEVQGMLQHYRL